VEGWKRRVCLIEVERFDGEAVFHLSEDSICEELMYPTLS